MTANKKVAIVGAGPAGMIAAIHAARNGCTVTVFEKQKKCGRKLSITGNGQCNISNRNIDVSRYHGQNPDFVRNVFARFGLDETIQFFDSIGIPVIEKKQGKLYPASLQAQSVTDILEYEMQRSGAVLHLHRRIDKIVPPHSSAAVRSGMVVYTAGHESETFDSVILAAGGTAYPQLGASPQGYELACALGHTLIDPFPAILPLNIPLKILHRLEGIKWDCTVKAVCAGKTLSESTGEVLFTKYGLSGPASLEISRAVNESILKKKNIAVVIDFFPYIHYSELIDQLKVLFSDGDKPLNLALAGILRKRIPDILLSIAGADPFAPCSSLNDTLFNRILSVLKSLSLEPGPIRPFSEAVITAGGISVHEVHPNTMESKIVKGLYLCGEILDIDGDSGGFNLQFAWSTGAIAGLSQV